MTGILFLVLFLCLFLTIPIAVSLAIASLTVFSIVSPNAPMVNNLAQAMLTSADSFPLMAIPFFMMVGSLMEETGVAKQLVKVADMLAGDRPGGLGLAAVIASCFFAAISGSGPATAAAIGGLLIPAMHRENYDDAYSAALIGAGSTIGPVIPPSIPMIMYGVTVGVSITEMFLAGFVPGLLMGVALIAYNFFVSKKRGYRGEANTANTKEKLISVIKALPALLMPVIVLGGIYGGQFTPTESAVVGVVYTLVVGIVFYKELTWKKFCKALVSAGVTSATIMILFGPATTFGRILTLQHVAENLTTFMQSLTNNGLVMILLVQIVFLLAGMFLDTISSVVLLSPLFAPLLMAYGFDPVYIGVIFVVNLCIGMITPPMGPNLYIAMRIANSPLESALKEALPMMLVLFGVLVILILFPPLVTFLPSLVQP